MLFDLSLDIDGIGGIVPGNSFHSSYLPQKYLDSCVFQASNVEHSVDSSGWTTSINGMMRSTLGYIFRDISVSKEIEELLENTKKDVAKAQKQKTKENVQISEIRRYNIKYMSVKIYLIRNGETLATLKNLLQTEQKITEKGKLESA